MFFRPAGDKENDVDEEQDAEVEFEFEFCVTSLPCLFQPRYPQAVVTVVAMVAMVAAPSLSLSLFSYPFLHISLIKRPNFRILLSKPKFKFYDNKDSPQQDETRRKGQVKGPALLNETLLLSFGVACRYGTQPLLRSKLRTKQLRR